MSAVHTVNGSLKVRVLQSRPMAVVQLSGVLLQSCAARLLQLVHRCLAEFPDVLILDVEDLRVDGGAVSVFDDVWRQAALWPAIPVLMCAASPALTAELAESKTGDRVQMHPTRLAACQAARFTPTRARIDRDLSADPAAPGQARAVVTDSCRRWGVIELADDARLIVSELVSNAFLHTSNGLIRVTAALRGSHLHLVVRDHDPRPPSPQRPLEALRVRSPELREGGRGLPLLHALSTSWGYMSDDLGKVVWSVLRTAN